MRKQTEEQKIEALKVMYEVVGKSFAEAYAEMGKKIAGIADALKENGQ